MVRCVKNVKGGFYYLYDVAEGREELAEAEMQKTSYQEGDSEEELSTPG